MEMIPVTDPPAQRRGCRIDFSSVQFGLVLSAHRRMVAWPWLLWFYAAAVALLSTSGAAQTAQKLCSGRSNFSTHLTEVNALVEIFKGFGNQSLGFPNWGNGEEPCGAAQWGGVVCQKLFNETCSTTVSGLQLTDLKIKGYLSPSVQDLKNLTFLNLAGNPELTGSIPPQLGNLAELVILDLRDNSLNGTIPSFLKLKRLQFLDLSGNQLVGIVPRWLGNLTQLQRLDLSNNQLNGSLPVAEPGGAIGLNNLTFAVQMSFSHNNLTGQLDGLEILSNLRILNGSNNHFNGSFPLPLLNKGNLSQLAVLDLSSNEITGILPSVQVRGLREIYMSNNILSGGLSPQFLNSPDLLYLNVDGNNISGTLNLRLLEKSSKLQLISVVNNSITDVQFPSNTSLIIASTLATLKNLFLGGNPYCSDPQTDLLLQICRSNPNEILTRLVRNSTNNKLLIIVVVIAGVVVLLASIISLIIIRRLYRRITILREIQREFAKNDVQPNLYSYTELKVATEDFSPDRMLGQGGFGVVYKGVLPDGIELAVKQLNNSDQVLAEFLNEIVTITNMRHKNLVKLKGCCVKGDQRMLVYEYVENKNLAEALWDSPSKGGRELDWQTRFDIIVGIARGLAYLHEEVTPPIIHRDIKAANILLDKDLNPKIGDFGLALLFPTLDDDRTHLSVNIAGTKGYLSPEYASYGQVSEKVDVFSFGILVLEIISGRKNINLRLPADQRYILEWAWKLYEAGTLADFIDPKLVDKSREEDIKQVVKLGLACVQYSPLRRPTMSSAVSMLLGHVEVDTINRDSELSKGELESMFATIATGSLTPVDEDSPLLVGLPTASASGAFIELGKLKPR